MARQDSVISAARTVRLGELRPGARFRLAAITGIEGELEHVGPSSATVKLGRYDVRNFETGDGEHVRFRRPERTTWSLDTRVFVLEEPEAAEAPSIPCGACEGEGSVTVSACTDATHGGGCPCGSRDIVCGACGGSGAEECWICHDQPAVLEDEDVGHSICRACDLEVRAKAVIDEMHGHLDRLTVRLLGVPQTRSYQLADTLVDELAGMVDTLQQHTSALRELERGRSS